MADDGPISDDQVLQAIEGSFWAVGDGYSLIEKWIKAGRLDVNRVLTEHNGSVSRSVMYYALEYDRNKTVKLLIAEGADLNRCLLDCIQQVHKGSFVKYLIEHGADPSVVCPVSGNNGLHEVIRADWHFPYKQVLILYFIEVGCDINHQNMQGRTPFHHAVFSLQNVRKSEFFYLSLKFLLLANCRLDIADAQGLTAIHHLANGISDEANGSTKRRILRMILKHKVDVMSILCPPEPATSALGVKDMRVVEDIILQRHSYSMDVKLTKKQSEAFESNMTFLNRHKLKDVNCNSPFPDTSNSKVWWY